MTLTRLTDRIWYLPFDDDRGRAVLGYIKGDRFSVAVDAGHSLSHVQDFYEALENENLPLPSLTVITHWHWDHAFGMHAVSGLTLSSRKTDEALSHLLTEYGENLKDTILSIDECIRLEYAGGIPFCVVNADMTYEDFLSVSPGGLTVRIFEAVSPHTDDTTLVYVPEEKCLFLGDAVCGPFPTWEVDMSKMKSLIRTVEGLDFTYAVTGHWDVRTKEALLADMRAARFK